MKVIHIISGGETGGSKNHLLSLLNKFDKDEVTLCMFTKGDFYDEALKLNLNVILLSQKSRYELSVIGRLVKVIQEGKFDIMHTHGPRANLFGLIVSKFVKSKWIITVHSDPRDDFIKGGLKGKIFTSINLKVLKRADHLFAVSHRFQEMLVKMGVQKENTTAIYNGIDFTARDIKLTRSDFGLDEEDFVIAMVARLHPIKGHVEVFRALKLIVDSNPGIKLKLVLVGDGPSKETLIREVKRLNFEDYVLFLGFQTDVHSILSFSDIKLLASYSESFPLVILESARAKTPVISTDVGGVKELISDPSLGWVVPIKDIYAIQRAIQNAVELKAAGQLQEIGNSLYEKASMNYSIDQLYEKIYTTYKKLL